MVLMLWAAMPERSPAGREPCAARCHAHGGGVLVKAGAFGLDLAAHCSKLTVSVEDGDESSLHRRLVVPGLALVWLYYPDARRGSRRAVVSQEGGDDLVVATGGHE